MTAPEVAAFGCARCFGEDPAAAWTAITTRRVCALVQESHFGVQVTACACGQHFAVVFTERIDWENGEDPQDWLSLPTTAEEVTRLRACDEAELPALLVSVGRGRRFLVRSHPSDGPLSVWWRHGGFAIGPHD